MKLVLLGPPGVGKGTQADSIQKNFSIPHISTGDILRENVKNSTELGVSAKKYMDSGELVPDVLILDMMEARFSKDDCEKGFLLDGFPRNEEQADALDKMLDRKSESLDLVILIEADSKILVKRAVGRRICRECGAAYHIEFRPSSKGNFCEKCGGELYQRPDDNEETILNRIEVYNNQTKPLIDYYQKQSKLFRVDGSKPLDDVKQEISKRLYDIH